jgi:hypothetical protein
MARTRGIPVALVAVTALAIAACGGGDSESASSDLSGNAAGGSSVLPNPEIEVGGGFDGSVQDCQELVSAFSVLALGPYTGLFAASKR